MTLAEVAAEDSTPRIAPPEADTCGFRVLRRLHNGERTHAFLAREPEGEQVVLRVFSGQEGPTRARAELALSALVTSGHLQRPRDVGATSGDEPVLICELLGSRLSQLLENGGFVAAGSLVTLTAPLASALHDLHSQGFAHGAVDAAHIRLSADGRPVLVGSDGGLPATPASIRSDLQGLAHVIYTLLQRTDEQTRSRGIADITSWLDENFSRPDVSVTKLYTDLECRIFALAPPLPFAVGTDDHSSEHRVDARRARALREREHGSVLTSLLEGELSFSLPAVQAFFSRVREAMRGRSRTRRLALVVIAVFILSVAGALWLLPHTSSAGATNSYMTDAPQTSSEPGRSASTSLAPDEALDELLDARSRCLRQDAQQSCLDEIYEPASPAYEADVAARRAGTADPFPVLSLSSSERSFSSPQKSGGVVIITVTGEGHTSQPVSVLLVKTETGWLIRDVFDG